MTVDIRTLWAVIYRTVDEHAFGLEVVADSKEAVEQYVRQARRDFARFETIEDRGAVVVLP